MHNNYLLVDWEAGGRLPPALTLARQLVERGHRVRVLCDPADEADILAAGCAFVPYARAPHRPDKSTESDIIRDWEATGPIDALTRTQQRIMFGPALDYARDVLDELAREPADALVINRTLFGAMLAAEKARLPFAVLMSGIYETPHPGAPPIGLGLMPAHGPLGRMRDAVLTRVLRSLSGRGLPALNAARTQLGLDPLGHPWEQFDRASRVLVLTSAAFDFPATRLPPNVRYVGPQLDEPAWAEPWQSPWPADQDHQYPLVVVGFSTTQQQQAPVLHKVIEALGGLRVRGLVTVGPALDPAAFHPPANVVVRASVSHAQVFPQANVVVTHAGHGTVIRALSYGIPLLCVPMGRDQRDDAARVVARGAGERLSPKASADQMRAAIRRLLEQPEFRASARSLAQALAADIREQRGVRELEGLVGGVHSPV
ncbi:MAG: glycosyltransferase [Nitrososphaerota archaeon]